MGYGLDGRSSILGEAGNFSLLSSIQTGSGSSLLATGYKGLFPRRIKWK
jgi:hypothetical protein